MIFCASSEIQIGPENAFASGSAFGGPAPTLKSRHIARSLDSITASRVRGSKTGQFGQVIQASAIQRFERLEARARTMFESDNVPAERRDILQPAEAGPRCLPYTRPRCVGDASPLGYDDFRPDRQKVLESCDPLGITRFHGDHCWTKVNRAT